MSPYRNHCRATPRRQRGAVLYIALIMLVLLALLGVVGMQVTGLQERMSSNYFAVNQAFQFAEEEAREAECSVEAIVNRVPAAGCASVTTASIDQVCDNGFDVAQWAGSKQMAPNSQAVNVRLIGRCISGNTSLDVGTGPISEDPNPVYQISAYATNPAATAEAAVDTIFRP